MEEGPKEGQQKLGVSRPQNVGPKEPSTPNACLLERVKFPKIETRKCRFCSRVIAVVVTQVGCVFENATLTKEEG